MRLFVLLMLSAAVLWGADAAYTVGPKGLTSLTWNGWQFLGDPSYQGEFNLYGADYSIRRSNGTTTNGSGNPTRTSSGNTVTQPFSWGSIASTWSKPEANRLAVRITVTNTSSNGDAITAVEGSFLVLDFPAPPTVKDGYGDGVLDATPRTINPLISPPLMVLGLDAKGSLTLGIDGDTTQAWRLGRTQRFNADTRYSLRWFCEQEVPAGQSRSMDFSLRFTTTDVAFLDAAPDLLMRYAGSHPPLGERADRRPIARDFLGAPPDWTTYPDTWGHPVGNPRGYFNNANDFDVRTDAGKAELRRRLLARADECIGLMRNIGAQGVVTWDIEGDQEPHAITYVGSPDVTYTVAPEMGYIPAGQTLDTASAYFKRFTDAGFKVGNCLRPQQYRATPGGPNRYEQVEAHDLADPVELMRMKVDYAVTRWGATLFYVDSNVSNVYGWPIADRWIFGTAVAQHPSIRIMGEWENAGSWGVGAPYNATWFDKVYETDTRQREVWPDGNSTIVIGSNDGSTQTPTEIARYVTAIKHGDVMMYDGWYASPTYESMRSIMTAVGQRPTCILAAPLPGAVLNQGQTATLRATPTAGTGTLTRVVWRSGAVVIASASAAPWTGTWTPTILGPHSLSVSVEDDRGCVTFSANHQVEVRVAGPVIVGDVNGDGVVDATDLNLVRGQFGRTGTAIVPSTADLDSNARVDANDLAIMARTLSP